jgi:hypothetical protein
MATKAVRPATNADIAWPTFIHSRFVPKAPSGRADDTGVCFIPRDVVLEVLDAAEQKAKAEAVRCKAIDDGVPVSDIARATYGEK